MRFRPWLFFLLVVGCTPKPQAEPAGGGPTLDREQAVKALKAQAREVGKAAVDADHDAMAKLTHPALVDKFGGREAYIKKLDSVASEMKSQGFRLKTFTVGEPSELVRAGGRTYAVVPTEVRLAGPGGAEGRQPSYLVAASSDGGAHWQFVDGSGVGGDRGKLKSLFPEFPDRLQLPAPEPAAWNKK